MRRIERALIFGVILVVSVAFLVGFAYKSSADTTPPEQGDWYIEEGENAVLDKDHTMNGSVFVAGTLKIDGAYTLEFDCDIQPYYLQVNSTGSLIMDNGAKIKAKKPDNMEKRMQVIDVIGDASIIDSTIEGVEEGIKCERDSSVTISSTTFNYCGICIQGVGTQAPSNNGGNYNNVDAKIVQRWYVNVTITNEEDGSVENAEVEIKNKYGDLVGSVTTGADGWADFGDLIVKKDDINYNDFKIYTKAHKDDLDNYHLIDVKTITLNNNYEGEKIKINALGPDFSIRDLSCEFSLMDLGESNKLTVTIRNMGEKAHNAQIKFSYKLKSEDEYREIDTITKEIPAKITDYKVQYDWIPKEAGNYDVRVEIMVVGGEEQYPDDDNSPSSPISVNVMQPTEIEINSPEEGETLSGEIEIEGGYKGTYDWIRVWLNDDEENYTEPYEILEETWKCKIDSGAFNDNQVIHAKIKGQSRKGVCYDWSNVSVTLKNEPKVIINSPKDKDVLTAKVENEEMYIGGWAIKVSTLAPDIKNVDLKIGGIKRNVILEKKNETYWKWNFDWNIAQLSNPVKDGVYTITAQAEDNEARKSDIKQISVTVDNHPPYSMVTIPKITITTKEPTEPVNKEILISGTVEDDWEVKKIEASIDKGEWFVAVDNINKDNSTWEYIWNVITLDKGKHTITFRAIDEETDKAIIEEYYPKESFSILKEVEILPDLSIESVKIMKDGKEVTKAKNEDNLTIEIVIKVKNKEHIFQPTKIYFALLEGKNTYETVNQTVDDKNDSFKVKIFWTAHGNKGNHNLTIEADVGNNLIEENEDNNVKNVQLELTDNPKGEETTKKKKKGFIPSIGALGIIIAMVAATSILVISKRKK